MTRKFLKGLAVSLVSVVHIAAVNMFLLAGLATAQTTDSEPPVIDMEIVSEGVRGETQVFSATVTDNLAVTTVVFHYRFDGETDYSSSEMALIPNTNVYTASVEPDGSSPNAIEYYIEARDGGDNRTLQGFSFDPLDRTLVSQAAIASSSSSEGISLSTNRKIVYGVLGLLVLGALAASSSGSSGGSSGGPGPSVPTQIVVEPFP